MTQHRLVFALAFSLVTSLLGGCGSDDDPVAMTVNGVCVRDDAQGTFCIAYTGVPADNAQAVETGCANNWGGAWTAAGSCQAGVLVGTCTLTGGAAGGAESAIMEVYEPTDAMTAEDDICGTDGTWAPAP